MPRRSLDPVEPALEEMGSGVLYDHLDHHAGAQAAPSRCTSLFWRVRPEKTAGPPFLAGPSISTSSVRPTRAW